MRVVILQPSYIPWLGYFDQMSRSDSFVLYDDVQFDKNGWRNRNRIKTPKGPQWLTVPVLTKGRSFPMNCEIGINWSVPWNSKHLKSVVQNYSKAPFFNDYIGDLEEIFSRRWQFLLDLNLAFIHMLRKHLGINTKLLLSSELKVPKIGKTERLVEICQLLGGTEFLEGAAGENYVDRAAFEKAGIKLEFHQYQHPKYHQLYRDFVPYLSSIDLLLNHGSGSLEILKGETEVG